MSNEPARFLFWAPSPNSIQKTNKLRFSDAISAKEVPGKYTTYRPPRLVQAKGRKYIEYYYRVPEPLMRKYNKQWMRFRVFENLNVIKTDEYAAALLKAVEKKLSEGHSPFETELAEIENPSAASWSLNYGLDQYLDYCKEKNLRKKSIQTYGIMINLLKDYFIKGNELYKPVTEFTKQDIAGFLKAARKKHGWANMTYNKYLTSLGTIFNWFVREEVIDRSPVKFEVLPVNNTRHRYYDTKTATAIKKLMIEKDPWMHKFCEFIYYTGIRPKSEARFLQVKHILFDRKLLFVPANISKNKKDDYVPMCDELIELLQGIVRGKPDSYFIFGRHGCEEKNVSQNYFASRYKPYKDKLNLDNDFSLYGWKHSRAIDMANAGATPYDIMKLFRHSSLDMTQKYLRDLGCNISDINQKTRKF
jgi:integrase